MAYYEPMTSRECVRQAFLHMETRPTMCKVEDLPARPEETFQKALTDVLAKNAELYRRLATG